MAELDVDAIQARADAADEGPWTTEPSSLFVQNASGEVVASFDWLAQTPEEWAQLEANAKFTAAARMDVPALVAAVRRVREAHQRFEYMEGPACRECVDAYEEPKVWPCPTIRALDGEAATDA